MELKKLPLGDATLEDLKRLKGRIETEIGRRTNTKKRDLLKKFEKMSAEFGLSIQEVVGKPAAGAAGEGKKRGKRGPTKKAAGAPRAKVAPKYHNPADTNETWTGRGRKPQWVVQQLAQGKTLQDLLINK